MNRRVRAMAVVLVGLGIGCGAADPAGGGDQSADRVTPAAGPATADAATPAPVPATAETVQISAGDRVLVAEVAADPAARQLGLMHREQLDANAGMLFVFPSTSTSGFWMKNTLIPLAIAFLATEEAGYRVVAVLEMEPCPADQEQCPIYSPEASYDAALEANSGWFDRAGVKVGDLLELEGPRPTASA